MIFRVQRYGKFSSFPTFAEAIVPSIMKRICLFVFLGTLLFANPASGQGVERVKDSKRSYNNIIDMLRGEPGLTISGTGDGGTMPDMYIRGIGTITQHTMPLLVVDGIKTDDIMYLQPEDVYSIKVIKDGTAAAYGMEGANGVIEIKTKAAVETQKLEAREKKIIRKKARKERKANRKGKREKPE